MQILSFSIHLTLEMNSKNTNIQETFSKELVLDFSFVERIIYLQAYDYIWEL